MFNRRIISSSASMTSRKNCTMSATNVVLKQEMLAGIKDNHQRYSALCLPAITSPTATCISRNETTTWRCYPTLQYKPTFHLHQQHGPNLTQTLHKYNSSSSWLPMANTTKEVREKNKLQLIKETEQKHKRICSWREPHKRGWNWAHSSQSIEVVNKKQLNYISNMEVVWVQ